MRTKEAILNEVAGLVGDFRFEPHSKIVLIEVLIDLRTNLKEISEQLKALGIEQVGER